MFEDKDRKNAPRGMFDEPPQEEKPKEFRGMFEEEAASHHMTKKKQTIIAAGLIVLVLAGMVTMIIMRRKWNRSILARYMAAPRSAWSVSCRLDEPQGELL